MSTEVRMERRWVDGEEVAPVSVTVDGRPLVVIDAENREEVERLHTLWCEAIVSKGTSSRQIDSMQAALREFANPKPVTVFEHFLDAQPVGDKGTARSICGKVWTPSKETESAGKCPVCVEMVEAGWAK